MTEKATVARTPACSLTLPSPRLTSGSTLLCRSIVACFVLTVSDNGGLDRRGYPISVSLFSSPYPPYSSHSPSLQQPTQKARLCCASAIHQLLLLPQSHTSLSSFLS